MPPHAVEPFFEIDALVRSPRDQELAPLDRAVTDAERADIDEFLDAAMPGLKKALATLREKDVKLADERYRSLYPKLGRAMELKKSDPETYALVLQALSLKRQINEHARVLAEYRDPAKADLQAQVSTHRKALEDAIDRGLTLAEQVRDRLRARRSKDRAEVVQRIADWAIQRERMESMERRDHDQPPRPDRDDAD